MVADIWLSKVVLDLIEKSSSVITAGETVSLVVESVSYVFTRLYMSRLPSPLADPEARGRGPLVQANS